MDKPLVIEIDNFEKEMVELINKYAIPATMKRRMLENFVSQLLLFEKQELEIAYNNEKNDDKTKEKSEENKNRKD